VLAGSSPIGTIDEGRVFSQAHPGAVYLHQGDSYLVEDLDVTARTATVRRAEVGYYTQPHEEKWVGISSREAAEQIGRFRIHLGRVEVETHVVAFKRRSIREGSVLGYEPLDLPKRRFTTQATWVTMPGRLLSEAAVEGPVLPGTLHAAEHASIAMLPLFAICDRWDVGGLSTPHHPEVEGPVWFVYDGYPGGAGIAPVGFAAGERHLRRTLAALTECPCEDGCPSCVQSPKCGNFNEPLDKAGAIRLLEAGLS
jgi:DEAD/DEAH box helicase domain-containing protein